MTSAKLPMPEWPNKPAAKAAEVGAFQAICSALDYESLRADAAMARLRVVVEGCERVKRTSPVARRILAAIGDLPPLPPPLPPLPEGEGCS